MSTQLICTPQAPGRTNVEARRRVLVLAFVSWTLLAVPFWAADADPIFLGPSPYLAFDNTPPRAETATSPFNGLDFDYFHLETFEDHLLNVPGVSFAASSNSGVTSVVFGPNVHDSVDSDDGTIDGSGLQGDSFFSPSGSTGIRFDFDVDVLGELPTHAGIVWTDGGGQITFQAFGSDGALLGSIGPVNEPGDFPDPTITGETAEDRFFGVAFSGGISAIFINGGGGGLEVDHLQYGFAPSSAIPEPSTLALVTLGLGVLGRCRRRHPRIGRARSAGAP